MDDHHESFKSICTSTQDNDVITCVPSAILNINSFLYNHGLPYRGCSQLWSHIQFVPFTSQDFVPMNKSYFHGNVIFSLTVMYKFSEVARATKAMNKPIICHFYNPVRNKSLYISCKVSSNVCATFIKKYNVVAFTYFCIGCRIATTY